MTVSKQNIGIETMNIRSNTDSFSTTLGSSGNYIGAGAIASAAIRRYFPLCHPQAVSAKGNEYNFLNAAKSISRLSEKAGEFTNWRVTSATTGPEPTLWSSLYPLDSSESDSGVSARKHWKFWELSESIVAPTHNLTCDHSNASDDDFQRDLSDVSKLTAGVKSWLSFSGRLYSSTLPYITDCIIDLAAVAYPNLREALRDLDQAKEDAREEGYEIPSHLAVGNARRILHEIYRSVPQHLAVYPMPGGKIAIDMTGGPGRSVLLLCNSDGGALCSVNLDGVHRRANYDKADELPDGFVRDALADLGQKNRKTL